MRAILLSTIPLAMAASVASAQGAVSGLAASYNVAKMNLVRAAEQMPEEHFAFKPTPEVRSFGGIVGHVANANYLFCAMATGEANPSKADFEKTTTKAGLVKAIKESFDFCDKAYQLSDAKGAEKISLFGMDTNRLGALAFNTAHDMEHYGNLVTYMRLKGQVPPSSQPQR